MSIQRNPFAEIERFFERMSEQFEEASSRWESGDSSSLFPSAFPSMAIDLVEQDDEFVATIDLPGFDRDDVDVRVTDSTLIIEAEHEESSEETEESYVRRERRHESASRSVTLPEEVDPEAVSARMKNGVLTVTMPRTEAAEARTIEVE